MAKDQSRIEVVPVGEHEQPSRRKHFLRLRGDNGRVLLVSPTTYGTRFHAERALESVIHALRQTLWTGSTGVTWPPKDPRVEILDQSEEDPNAS